MRWSSDGVISSPSSVVHDLGQGAQRSLEAMARGWQRSGRSVVLGLSLGGDLRGGSQIKARRGAGDHTAVDEGDRVDVVLVGGQDSAPTGGGVTWILLPSPSMRVASRLAAVARKGSRPPSHVVLGLSAGLEVRVLLTRLDEWRDRQAYGVGGKCRPP